MPGRLILYTRRTEEMVAFYTAHFGYRAIVDPADRIVELNPDAGGTVLLLHPLAKGRKEGQTLIKLVFDVADVAAVRARLIAAGVEVGPVHEVPGYAFANLKDPAGNPLSISSRAHR